MYFFYEDSVCNHHSRDSHTLRHWWLAPPSTVRSTETTDSVCDLGLVEDDENGGDEDEADDDEDDYSKETRPKVNFSFNAVGSSSADWPTLIED